MYVSEEVIKVCKSIKGMIGKSIIKEKLGNIKIYTK